jgi:8-oxo-dGTP diphosphatase
MPGREYQRRPGGYAVLFDAVGAVAVVWHEGVCYLPGGGAEPGESLLEAMHREVAEECGWTVDVLGDLGLADESFEDADGICWVKAGQYFLARVSGAARIPREAGHTVMWVRPRDAAQLLAHPSQVWAVEAALARCGPERPLPPEFFAELRDLERAYLSHDDPIAQSGFKGGEVRWRAEREPILAAVRGDAVLTRFAWLEKPC